MICIIVYDIYNLPVLDIIERTSAKSTFIRPGLSMISDIPMIPFLRMSSAIRNESQRDIPVGTVFNNFSFDITISASTFSFSSAIAASA